MKCSLAVEISWVCYHLQPLCCCTWCID